VISPCQRCGGPVRPEEACARCAPTPRADVPLVAYDADLSTAYTAVYWATSDSVPGRRYKVSHDHRLQLWRCECASFRRCRHIVRAELFEKRRFWERLFEDYTPAMLRGVVRDKASIEAVGLADLDDLAARDVAEALLARLEEAA